MLQSTGSQRVAHDLVTEQPPPRAGWGVVVRGVQPFFFAEANMVIADGSESLHLAKEVPVC